MIYNKKYNSHTDPLFKWSGILKMSDIYHLEVLLFMHDYIHYDLPISFNGIFKFVSDNHAYSTRQSGRLFALPRTKSRFVDKLPIFQYPNLWNKNIFNLDNPSSRACLKRTITASRLGTYQATVECNNPMCHDCFP